jgi:hypothetical protein
VIRITRTEPAPGALAAGDALVQAMHEAFAARPGVAGTKAEPFEFDRDIYGDPEVKQALAAMQHGKCGYCEGDFAAFSYGDTEHQRPKAYSQQATGSPTIRPGYYWLAYDWLNLVLSCELCNRARKRNLFPLRNPAARARTPELIADEDPLLLDPTGTVDPRQHIRFQQAVPTGLTDVGRTTIDCLALDRIALTAARLRHYRRAAALATLMGLAARPGADAELQAAGAEAAVELEEMVKPAEPFSAMILDFLGR